MKFTPTFTALFSVLFLAICLEQAQADSVTAPLALTEVGDQGKPTTPLSYLNLEPAAQQIASAATPHRKRLLPTESQPFVSKLSSEGLSLRALDGSLLSGLPLVGQFDHEGDYTNVAAQKRLLGPLSSLAPSEDTQYLQPNQQQLGSVHPLDRRATPSGLNVFGNEIPVDAVPLDALPLNKLGKGGIARRDEPVDLGLKTGNPQDVDAAESLLSGLLPVRREVKPVDLGLKTGNPVDVKSLLSGLLPIKRDVPVQPVDLGLKTGNAQDADRAQSLLGSLLPVKRDSISPDNVDLGSLQSLATSAAGQGKESVMPLALGQVKQAASPAVQAIKTVNQVCTAFGCERLVRGAVQGALPASPLPAGAIGKRGDPAVDTILDTSDQVRDAVLNLKSTTDNAAGEFVKSLYGKTKRETLLPGYSLLPGTGPGAKNAVKEIVDFVGLPLPGKRGMERRRKV
ncbi:hypothetical protein PSEUBRA_000595 [Kalmanozyma brasiliensis GHG001]|uniref:Uncharacterized protein n=1 Tax=Kalmanozyma brasiliensis (strain GHG001) TaxID=1365824 RepID=V5GWB1_KALBG|nr:uncharacterized protein PSEUBRA_000595 [Kalmanozyma brasiliensis GHG001]EST10182.1 hypothetical protein PSEUBRA_000595 [Kalmanozyma brasiliensis GHG001]